MIQKLIIFNLILIVNYTLNENTEKISIAHFFPSTTLFIKFEWIKKIRNEVKIGPNMHTHTNF